MPDSAIASDQSRKIVFTVADDGTVGTKLVELGPIVDGLRVIRSGLAATDRIVIDGLQRARPGQKVKPEDGKIEAAQSRPTSATAIVQRQRQLSCGFPISSSIGRSSPASSRSSSRWSAPSRFARCRSPNIREIAPPTVVVSGDASPAPRPRSSPQTVAAPIEQEINGVDNMLYVVSQSTGDGALSINVVFKPGTNIDQAQVLVQNRVSVAVPRLPRRGAAHRRDRAQELARPDAGDPSDLAGREPRPAVHLQLRDHQHQGRPHAHRRRRRHHRVRRARLFDAGLARSGQGAGARPDRERRGGGAARRQRPGRRRRHQSAAGDVAGRVRAGGADARAAVEPGAVQRHRGRDRSRTGA